MSRIAVDHDSIEDHALHNEIPEFMSLIKHYKAKGCYQDVLGMRYNHGKSNLFHLTARKSTIQLIKSFFDFTESIMGKNFLTYELNTTVDRNGRTFVIIAAKHLSEEILTYLFRQYNLDPGFYAAYNKSSAFTYLIKRQLTDCMIKALAMIDQTKLSEDGFDWFLSDMELLKDTMTEKGLIEAKWFSAMTYKFKLGGRISKMQPFQISSVASFAGDMRMRQILRHVSTQLFLRWKYYLGFSDLEDVQLLYMIKKMDRNNPNPKPLVFVACTPLEVGEYVKEDYKTRSLKEMLTRIYDCHQHDEEGDKRSTRFANKFRSRAWGPKVKRQTRGSRDIIDLLNVDKKKVQKVVKLKTKVKMPYLDLTENGFYLAIPGGNYLETSIHAEELLCDVSSYLYNAWDHKSVIYGKNRPCLSCCGRMKSEAINEYNKKHGFLYSHAIEFQEDDAKLHTLSLLYTSPSYITCKFSGEEQQTAYKKDLKNAGVGHIEGPEDYEKFIKGYDTASDSDDDES